MKIHFRRVSVLVFLLTLVAVGQQASSNAASPASLGAPPPLIQFSGLATDEGGTPFTGNVRMTFMLYPTQHEGEPLWSEAHDVQVDGTGHYSVQLGATNSGGVPAL